MATTTSVATKELVKYRVEDGVAIFELGIGLREHGECSLGGKEIFRPRRE